ncbi:MAG: hypothetical protein E7L17_14640 [Clostridium sp.]|uniref:hypothetical protein n=1 Tax=Clostridium sp. TaxID=1506 RepID=UPI00290DE035|nr:hypothetical protein [Clostridium sp.]MDU7339338.1 hypothetical protein [Clostridium sp.]
MEIKQAIEYLEEQKKLFPHSYNALSGCFDTAISSLEKQMPKKVKRKLAVWPDGLDRVMLFCPACHDGYELSPDEKYCSECGQCLDWSVNNE